MHMTPEERAALIMQSAPPLLVTGDDWGNFEKRIAAAIREAVLAEKEGLRRSRRRVAPKPQAHHRGPDPRADPVSEAARCVLTGMYAGDPPVRVHDSWCGRKDVPRGEWTFLDASHAALAIRAQSRIMVCTRCCKAIAEMFVGEGEGG